MLHATDLHVKLGQVDVLKGVSFSARATELTAIVGPNGSGKTTLLRAITQEIPYKGRVTMGGEDIAKIPPADLAILRAVLPQASRIAFPFTVLEIVRLGLLAGRYGAQSSLPKQALARVGLQGFEGRYFQDLSGGEQQRVQLARVLAQVWEPLDQGRPRWLFLDEPVSSLDIGHQLKVMQTAKDFATAGGGVVAVMHDLNLTAMYADRIVLMADGQILAQGSPQDVICDDTLSDAYRCALKVNLAPEGKAPFVLPHHARRVA